ncbi:transcriptional repressor [Sulfurimonas sp. MAG313]|nr:Fur family transcriptional regulator [Sulfurimonas sp. MAG313]MDF1880974.1 transcriptional repressor [Sulfurimonas sp. MAG313]
MNYAILLHEHTLKATPQRLGILSLMGKNGHLSIDDLFIQIKQEFTSISLATLYKNINAMLDTALIAEVKIPNMKSKYEITKTPHAHLVCDRCAEFKDIHINLDSLIRITEDQSNYKLSDTSLIFSGLCEKCK